MERCNRAHRAMDRRKEGEKEYLFDRALRFSVRICFEQTPEDAIRRRAVLPADAAKPRQYQASVFDSRGLAPRVRFRCARSRAIDALKIAAEGGGKFTYHALTASPLGRHLAPPREAAPS